MSTRRLFTILAAACLLLIGSACDPAARNQAEAEKIKQLNQEWFASVKSGDVDKIVGYFAANTLSLVKGEPIYTDSAKIRQLIKEQFSDPLYAQSFRGSDDSVEVSGNMAWNWGTVSYQVSSAAGPMEATAKWVTLWKKIDGNWKVILDYGTDLKSVNPPYSSEALVRELTEVEERWNEATLKKDANTLDLILAAEYTYTDDQVGQQNKAQAIGDVVSGKTTFLEPAKLSDIQVTSYGAVAIVRASNTIKGILGGQKVSGTFRFVDVFVWRDGRWQCVSTK